MMYKQWDELELSEQNRILKRASHLQNQIEL